MTGYYHAKRTQQAKQYLEQREAEQRIGPVDNRYARSKVWLAKYLARPSRTNFNWAPRYPINLTPPEEPTNVEVTEEEIIEGEFTVVADHAAAGDQTGSARQEENRAGEVGHAAQRRRPTRTGEFETPF